MSNIDIDWNQRYLESNTPWDSGLPSEELKRVLSEGWVKPCRMLEIGCGTGTNAIFLAGQGFQVTAVDLSEVALDQARAKAQQGGANIKFVNADVTCLPDLGPPFQFLFDRGTYHIIRRVNLPLFQSMLSQAVAPLGIYAVLAGNANEVNQADEGPPRVSSHELCEELEAAGFDLVQLHETRFHGIRIKGDVVSPLAWSAVLRRKAAE